MDSLDQQSAGAEEHHKSETTKDTKYHEGTQRADFVHVPWCPSWVKAYLHEGNGEQLPGGNQGEAVGPKVSATPADGRR